MQMTEDNLTRLFLTMLQNERLNMIVAKKQSPNTNQQIKAISSHKQTTQPKSISFYKPILQPRLSVESTLPVRQRHKIAQQMPASEFDYIPQPKSEIIVRLQQNQINLRRELAQTKSDLIYYQTKHQIQLQNREAALRVQQHSESLKANNLLKDQVIKSLKLSQEENKLTIIKLTNQLKQMKIQKQNSKIQIAEIYHQRLRKYQITMEQLQNENKSLQQFCNQIQQKLKQQSQVHSQFVNKLTRQREQIKNKPTEEYTFRQSQRHDKTKQTLKQRNTQTDYFNITQPYCGYKRQHQRQSLLPSQKSSLLSSHRSSYRSTAHLNRLNMSMLEEKSLLVPQRIVSGGSSRSCMKLPQQKTTNYTYDIDIQGEDRRLLQSKLNMQIREDHYSKINQIKNSMKPKLQLNRGKQNINDMILRRQQRLLNR